MTHAILSTILVLIPTVAMLAITAIAYERDPHSDRHRVRTRLEYDRRRGLWRLYLIDESGDPVIEHASKREIEEIQDWLENEPTGLAGWLESKNTREI